VLATLFSIVALWCVLEGLLRRSARWYAAAGAAYYLALLSKEHAVMLPAVALALAVLVRGRATPVRALAREFGGWMVVYAAIAATMIVQRQALIGAAYEPFAADPSVRHVIGSGLAYPLSVINQATLFFRYLATWLLPWPGWMSIDLRTPFPAALLSWPQTAGFAAWLAYPVCAGALILRGGRLGLAGFGLLYPWLLSLTEFSTVRLQEPFVLYRSYLWMSGLPAILPALMAPLASRWRARAAVAAGAGVAASVALALVAHGRMQTFSSSIALWDDAVRKDTYLSAPYAERPYVSRGLAYLEAARNDAAAADLDRALEINPRSPDAYLGRGTVRLRTGLLPEALADLDSAIGFDPGYPAAYHKRCIVKAALDRWREAAPDCDKAVELNPLDEEAWINRGAVYRELRRPADAAESYERALALKPRSGSAHFNYGVLLLDAGRRDAAVLEHFRRACEARVPEACELARRLAVSQEGTR
jgi:tetratricopeptide (TPR) repeat protein